LLEGIRIIIKPVHAVIITKYPHPRHTLTFLSHAAAVVFLKKNASECDTS
jgi:hypothetical protein